MTTGRSTTKATNDGRRIMPLPFAAELCWLTTHGVSNEPTVPTSPSLPDEDSPDLVRAAHRQDVRHLEVAASAQLYTDKYGPTSVGSGVTGRA